MHHLQTLALKFWQGLIVRHLQHKLGHPFAEMFDQHPAGHVHRLIFAGALDVLAVGTWLHWWPLAVTLAFAGMGALSFIAYALDKSAANQNLQRTQEKTLHLFDLLCGWPGGLLAQQIFRHKTRKISFQIVFWITVVVNCAALFWLVPQIGTAS